MNAEEDDLQLVAARELLQRLIRGTGHTLQSVDLKSGFTRGWVGRIVHGDIRLTYDHILRILDAIGVDPHLFFTTLHPPPRREGYSDDPGDFIEETRALAERVLRQLPPPAAPGPREAPAVTDDELEARIGDAVRAVLAERRCPAPALRRRGK